MSDDITSDQTAGTGTASDTAAAPPVRHVGPPPQEQPASEPPAPGSVVEGTIVAMPEGDPRKEKRAERLIGGLFTVSALASIGFVVAYFWTDHSQFHTVQNLLLAGCLTVALFLIGVAFVVWAKQLMPHELAMQERHPSYSDEPERREAADIFLAGTRSTQIARRPMLKRTMGLSLGVLALPAVVALRDLGTWVGRSPATELKQTAWKKGDKLVDPDTGQPVNIADMALGSIKTVMPQGFEKLTEGELSLVPTILIRMRPDELKEPTHLDWTVNGYVAYSKICVHAGCPISLYEQQTHHLLCPCHQSTFQVNEGCKVIFGPAARPMPQLPIGADANGNLYALSDYDQPVGPSFWERG